MRPIPSGRINLSAYRIDVQRGVESANCGEETSEPPRRRRAFERVFANWRWWTLAAIIVVGLGGVLAEGRRRGHSDLGLLTAEIRLALKNRQWSRAEAMLTLLSGRRAPSAEVAVLRAEVELGRGRVDRAVSLLQGIPESDPRAAGARLVAGQIEFSRHRARWAEALFLEAVRFDPNLAPARRELIFLYAMQARRDDLNAQFRALADLEPLDFDAVFLWTSSLEDRWVNDVIQPHLERFVAADPLDRLSRLALTAVFLRAARFDDAQALLVPLPDSDADARVLRARLALGRLQVDEARALVAEGPVEHVGLALIRAQLAVQSNEPAAAARQFRIALRLDPADREALQGLSLVLKQVGEREEASSSESRAEQWRHLTSMLQKSKTPGMQEDKAMLSQLGEACEGLGQNAEARAWYRLALARDPLDAAVQKSLYRLRQSAP
jgi:tetratricopeptide (TPR) repeat protein